jgi:chemotaxis protein methyltransferase CheR
MRPISSAELAKFQQFIFNQAGITLSASKKELVMGRLGKRLGAHQLHNFSDYFALLESGDDPAEVQMAVDLLTTNETYFFREMKHFDFLRQRVLEARKQAQSYRIWSAASSSGEEAYSIAMVLADVLTSSPWEVLGTDISTKVLAGATRALYPMERAQHIPAPYLRRFCLKGEGTYEGKLLVARELRSRVNFRQVNLNEPLPHVGQFDFIFLRNVMIYFNDETKRQVVARLISALKPGAFFCVGHSESLNGISQELECVAPSVYRKPV